jgi:hypothetical protein
MGLDMAFGPGIKGEEQVAVNPGSLTYRWALNLLK